MVQVSVEWPGQETQPCPELHLSLAYTCTQPHRCHVHGYRPSVSSWFQGRHSLPSLPAARATVEG